MVGIVAVDVGLWGIVVRYIVDIVSSVPDCMVLDGKSVEYGYTNYNDCEGRASVASL